MPPYTLAVVDQHGCGRPAIQALMYREDTPHIATFLLASKKPVQDSDISNTIFLVDKDTAEIVALHTVFPGQTGTVAFSSDVCNHGDEKNRPSRQQMQSVSLVYVVLYCD